VLNFGVQTPCASLVGLTGKIPAKKGAVRNLLILGQPLPRDVFHLVNPELQCLLLHLDQKYYRIEQI